MAIENTLIHKRIQVRIPKNYHQEPVIYHLVSDYNLIVNINAATLGVNGAGDGWFDLDLQGKPELIYGALSYLNELKLEVWGDTGSDN